MEAIVKGGTTAMTPGATRPEVFKESDAKAVFAV